MNQEANVTSAARLLRLAATDLSDEEIVHRVRNGRTDLFEILMRRHNQSLYRAVRSILRDDAETEDVLQETYVRSFIHLHQFGGRARFSTWLTRIAVHEAFHRQKRRRRFTEMTEEVGDRLESPSPGPEHGASSDELRKLLEAAIDHLPEEFRTVFVLRDVEELSTAETAERLALPVETVKTRLHRARRRLRGHLDRAVGESVREVFAFGNVRCDRLVEAVMDRINNPSAAPSTPEKTTAPLRLGPDLYRTLVEECPDAIVVADRTGVIRLWNNGAEALFGYAAADALGQSLDLIIPEKQRQRHWAGYDAVMATGSTRYGSELLKVPATHRDGRRLSIEFRVALLRDDSGAVAGVAAFLRDATEAWTERQRLLKRLRAAGAAEEPEAQ